MWYNDSNNFEIEIGPEKPNWMFECICVRECVCVTYLTWHPEQIFDFITTKILRKKKHLINEWVCAHKKRWTEHVSIYPWTYEPGVGAMRTQ